MAPTKTEVLIEALPYIQRFEGRTFVVKYGGAAMADETLRESFAQDVTMLKKIGIRIVIVHGGGKEITDVASRLGISTHFVDGQRYTDAPMMEVVQMVLAGKTNKEIVARINRHEGGAIGLCGIDANLIVARKANFTAGNLGFVGTVARVNTQFLTELLDNGIMPVIAPVGVDVQGQSYNINADVAAAAIAGAVHAEKLVFLSDVEGLLVNDELVHSIGREDAGKLIDQGIIVTGMVPKIRSAFDALDAGVHTVHMIDGRVKHSLLLEIFTREGIGTEVVPSSLSQPLEVAL